MHEIDFAKLGVTAIENVSKHSPEILTGMGILGFVSAMILVAKTTPNALKEIEDAKERKAVEDGIVEPSPRDPEKKIIPMDKVSLTKKEIIRAAWKCYIPAAAMGLASASCIIAATSINNKRKVAAATAFEVTRAAFADYKEKVVETFGEKKEEKIRDEVSKEHVTSHPASNQTIIAGSGTVRCYDEWTGQYFNSDVETIRKAINTLNYRMISGNEMYVSLNDFYYELDIPSIPLGEELGWNINNGQVEVTFSSVLPEDGRPVLAINYNVAPRYDYSKLM